MTVSQKKPAICVKCKRSFKTKTGRGLCKNCFEEFNIHMPMDINEECEKIQKTWSKKQRKLRTVYRPEPLTVYRYSEPIRRKHFDDNNY